MNYRQTNLRSEYLKQSVLTASPLELIIMLFDSCIKNLRLAEICLTEHNDIAGTNSNLINAQKIIIELTNCLDTKIEISEQLIKIYDFLLSAIRQINAKKDMSLMPDVLEIMISLRDTWQQLKSKNLSSAEVS